MNDGRASEDRGCSYNSNKYVYRLKGPPSVLCPDVTGCRWSFWSFSDGLTFPRSSAKRDVSSIASNSSLLSEETHLSVCTCNLYFLQSATCSIYLAFSSLKHDSVHHYFSSEQSRDHISMAAIPGASIRQ